VKITGTMILRNAVKLGYPFDLAIRSLRPLCDEVIILVDPNSEDDTLDRVLNLNPDVIVESPWDMTNHKGHTNCEISLQTETVCNEASGDWVFSLQADEVLHEGEVPRLRTAALEAQSRGVSGLELVRLYFYGSLSQYRTDWTIPMVRFFKRGAWKPDVDGAMRFDPCTPYERKHMVPDACIYHYSRVGDPQMIAERVRNLDGFFHEPERIEQGAVQPYDFSSLRKLDTYVIGSTPVEEGRASLADFPLEGHPKGVVERFS
jgi:hypothetical protein